MIYLLQKGGLFKIATNHMFIVVIIIIHLYYYVEKAVLI